MLQILSTELLDLLEESLNLEACTNLVKKSLFAAAVIAGIAAPASFGATSAPTVIATISVPEPSALFMLAAGLVGVSVVALRRK